MKYTPAKATTLSKTTKQMGDFIYQLFDSFDENNPRDSTKIIHIFLTEIFAFLDENEDFERQLVQAYDRISPGLANRIYHA